MGPELKKIIEKVYVETPVDTDGDGMRDLIAVYIVRPETCERVPCVMVADPYLMFCNDDWYDLHDVDIELIAYPAQNIDEPDVLMSSSAGSFGEFIDFCSLRSGGEAEGREIRGIAEPDSCRLDALPDFDAISGLYEKLNGLGYATVFSGGLGTRGSDGFTLSGSPEEIAAFRAVIDWLNGRARAFSDRTSGLEVKADWCTGNVAMSGKSYLGTLCFGVAATGVEGLKAIIPEAGISSWYEYYRHNGLCVSPFDWQGDDSDLLSLYCMSRARDPEDFAKIEAAYRNALEEMNRQEDRESGNYNEFWDKRNYVKHASEFKAATFIIHGLNDWNVKPDHAINMYRALSDHGKECRMMLHQGEHIYIYDLKDSGCFGAVTRWLDHYLKGIDNGAENEPRILVESNLDQSIWYAGDSWPPEGTKMWEFPVDLDGTSEETLTITDDISGSAYDKETDDRKAWRDQLVLGSNETEEDKRCLKFFAGPFEEDVRIAGPVSVYFRASFDRPTAVLSAMMVDLGEMKRLSTGTILTGNPDDPDEFVFKQEEEPSAYKVITRGWLNAQNRTSTWSKEEIIPGEFYDYRVDMVETDYTLRAGHRLELVLYGTDADFTVRQPIKTEILYDISGIKAEILIIG